MNQDEIEHDLKRSLIAVRSMGCEERIAEMENKLYEYRLKIGSAAVYYTYERNNNG